MMTHTNQDIDEWFSQPRWDGYGIRGDYSPLPFTHGTETELLLVNSNGMILPRKVQAEIVSTLPGRCATRLERMFETGVIPRPIEQKITTITVEKTKKKGHALKIGYKVGSSEVAVEAIARDPNFYAGGDFLLEPVTPPCTSLYELMWWNCALLKLIQVELMNNPHYVDVDAHVMSIGSDPMRDQSGYVTCGDHHHIGVPDPEVRIQVYNMIRAFMPHIIALTVNSPFSSGGPTSPIGMSPDGSRFWPKMCIRSIRLTVNDNQLGPNQPTYLPYLQPGDGPEEFKKKVRRTDPRLVDMYPFSGWNTIEVRAMDAQNTSVRRVANALIIQMMAATAAEIHKAGKIVPDIPAQDLFDLRRRAIEKGLLGSFNLVERSKQSIQAVEAQNDEFASYYYNTLMDTSARNDRFTYAVHSMFALLLPQIRKYRLMGSCFLRVIYALLYENGGDGFSPASLLLRQFYRMGSDMKSLNRYLVQLTYDASTLWYDPLLQKME